MGLTDIATQAGLNTKQDVFTLEKKPFVFHTSDTYLDLSDVALSGSIQMLVDGGGIQMESIPGGTLAEDLIDQTQLNSTDGILGGEFIYNAGYPSEGQTWTLKTDTKTVAYTFTATPSGDYDMLTGSGDIMPDFVTKINANHVAHGDPWTAILINPVPALSDYAPFIMSNDATGRMYGNAWQVKNFNGIAYSLIGWSPSVAPTSDPAVCTLGFMKAKVSLSDGELHQLLAQGTHKAWNAGADAWQLSSPGTAFDYSVDYTGGAGGKTRITYESRLLASITNGTNIVISYLK
jgi:hypothetical protein